MRLLVVVIVNRRIAHLLYFYTVAQYWHNYKPIGLGPVDLSTLSFNCDLRVVWHRYKYYGLFSIIVTIT